MLFFLRCASLIILFTAGMSTAHGQQVSDISPPFHGIVGTSPGGSIFVSARNSAQANTAANLFIYNSATGVHSTARILNDFPNTDQVQTWSLSANQQEVVIAAILVSSDSTGTKAFRNVILHYALDGSLKAVWDTTPYTCHDITETSKGTVYCYGYNPQGVSGSDTFLIHRYSPSGEINGRYLDAGRLPRNVSPQYANARSGRNLLRVDDYGHIAVWVAPAYTLLLLNESSPNVTGVSLADLASSPEAGASSQVLHVTGLFFTPNHSIGLQVVTYGTAIKSPPPLILVSRVIILNITNGALLQSSSMALPAPVLVGYSQNGNLMGLQVGSSVQSYKLLSIGEPPQTATPLSRANMIHPFTLK